MESSLSWGIDVALLTDRGAKPIHVSLNPVIRLRSRNSPPGHVLQTAQDPVVSSGRNRKSLHQLDFGPNDVPSPMSTSSCGTKLILLYTVQILFYLPFSINNALFHKLESIRNCHEC
jgi:hypothetical protein